ncbi:NADP-dependent oxidoreductase domain-containing protein [Vararia minispora EC-137]|uniref:NADP-dependent oxidoreductase domain-containing protein n=1 Tax=Vararia minispora EC-137 TaxID=1314806 RepID=A0ACB8QLJ2_9AGAM|nr:NADP-dependent oxidoreductase domain-containing protein [Vararia minispora EC-137]
MPISLVKLNDGNSIPWIGYGTGTALFKQDCEKLVVSAIHSGFTHIDGAQMYSNENSLGAGVVSSGKSRTELFVTTKLLQLGPGQSVRDTLVKSLQELKTDYVNLFLVHTPTNFVGRLKETWKEMEAVKAEGLAKSIGVSNFRQKELEVILGNATIIPAVNQIEFHPHLYKEERELVEYNRERGIVTSSFGGLSPLFRSPGSAVDELAKSIAARLSKETGQAVSDSQVLLLWAKKRGIVVITTSTKTERMKEYLHADKLPELTDDDVASIDEAGSLETHRHFSGFYPKD